MTHAFLTPLRLRPEQPRPIDRRRMVPRADLVTAHYELRQAYEELGATLQPNAEHWDQRALERMTTEIAYLTRAAERLADAVDRVTLEERR